MKTPLAVRPVFMKSPRRVEALVTHHRALKGPSNQGDFRRVSPGQARYLQ
jgi:hypothetical protein